MKRLSFLLLVLCGCSSPHTEPIKVQYKEIAVTPQKTSWERFVDAVIQVESEGNDSAVGDGGKAVGCLQIHKIMVDEANRLGGDFTYEDRWDRYKSIAIFNIVQKAHNPSLDYERACQIWNPNAGSSYYNKVLANYGI